jgi:hypothetical protein
LDSDRWQTCEDGSKPCSFNGGNLLILTKMTASWKEFFS